MEGIVMPGKLTHFKIEALHNRYTINLEITDNKLVLIGENGAGKSTIVNFIYLFLTQQWRRITALYDFKSIIVKIDSNEIKLTKEEILKSITTSQLLGRFPSSLRQRLSQMLAEHPTSEVLNNPEAIELYSVRYGIPRGAIMEYLDAAFEEFPHSTTDRLEEVKKLLKSSFTDKVLYLPTYRRIEQDLAFISPELASSLDFEKAMDRWHRRARSEDYIELVEFGMGDVERTIKSKMRELSDGSRSDLGKLTSTYLRDVILGAYQNAEPAHIDEVDEDTIKAIFNRIDQSVLPKPEQLILQDNIREIRTNREFQDKDKVVVHFLIKLIDFYKLQQEKEKHVQDFVDVCNQYLTGKSFFYDIINFDVSIRLQSLHTNNVSELDSKEEILKMSKLSSGEKQIVSLFSEIYQGVRVNAGERD